jgi:outer membrane protein OmpA-like peptidoglycan-associated protein
MNEFLDDQGDRFMTRRAVSLILCGSVALLGSACATKTFVQEQVNASEDKLSQQMTAGHTEQETKLRETSDRIGETRQAVDIADQRLNGLDLRVGEVGSRASNAETRADQAAAATRDAEARLSQRLAGRNRYRLLETRAVYFESGRTDVRSQDAAELDAAAKAITADPNAILELQGFADSRGSDRHNLELARDRVEAVMRYLVQRHGIELRQVRSITMGKVEPVPGEKTTAETLAKARRVDMRLLAPWSSWEDSVGRARPTAPENAAASEPRGPSTMSALPPRGELAEFLKTLTPTDLGGAR